MSSPTSPGPEQDPMVELRELSVALGAYARWQATTGATGLPRATEADLRARSPQPLEPSAEPTFQHQAAVVPRVVVPGVVPEVVPGGVPAAALSLVEQRARLTVLQAEVAGCQRCALHARRTQTVFARGNGSSGVCFVGEGPGEDEDRLGAPFVGKAGQLLDRMIAAMGLDREAVYVCNIVKCRPPDNRKPEPAESHACAPYLAEQISLVEPKVMVALGATAVEGLLGVTGGITRLRGSFRLYKGRIPVMPTFHPAYLLRKPAAKREVWSDLQAVMKHLGLKAPQNPRE